MEPTVCCVPLLMIWDVPEDPIGDERKPERFVLGLVDVGTLTSEYWELEEALAVVPAAGHQFLEELVLMILSELWIGNGVGNLVLDGHYCFPTNEIFTLQCVFSISDWDREA
ncbi:hypothetical protein GCK72_025170 [Caenorhabditis remanei]|uniref:Uncharacterized protein n=1 Tax=Caenorhabditis remanei TaxID=31234 RepID=A0A6A5G1M9_CAERE|nr:hypothetical protein GCK72_025170 [Caenorhabditis remanei]KAF1748703.1 hypothetical protein GCK72_025170 [Caenorhabditis remanei]